MRTHDAGKSVTFFNVFTDLTLREANNFEPDASDPRWRSTVSALKEGSLVHNSEAAQGGPEVTAIHGTVADGTDAKSTRRSPTFIETQKVVALT